MNKVLIDKTYSAESIVDIEQDITDVINYAIDIPKDKHGFHKGSFKLTLEFIPNDEN